MKFEEKLRIFVKGKNVRSAVFPLDYNGQLQRRCARPRVVSDARPDSGSRVFVRGEDRVGHGAVLPRAPVWRDRWPPDPR